MFEMGESGMTQAEAIQQAKDHFKGKPQFVFMFQKNMDLEVEDRVVWKPNIESIFRNFDCIPYFDESLRFHGPCYHLVGEKSRQYPLEIYKRVFTNIKRDDIQVVKGAGHWVHYDKPLKTIELVSQFIDKIDRSHIILK